VRRVLTAPRRSRVLNLILRKLVQGVLMLFAVSAIAFWLLSAAGGDALSAMRENPQVSEETVQRLRQVYGLDRPVSERYFNWLSSFVRGDAGESIIFRSAVSEIVLARLLNTLKLGFIALAIALAVAFGMSLLSARYRNRTIDRVVSFIILITASTPRIVLALFALALTVAVSGTAVTIRDGSLGAMLLAAFVLSFPLVALFLAQLHGELTRVMDEPFVVYARAKGLSENAVIFRHAMRAAINPLLTLLGLSFGAIVSGSVIVETVLGWPGIGALTVAAVKGRDVPLVMGTVVIASAAVWLGNSLAELLQMLNDKRLRSSETD
jgi:peptide/nickel transport system permease protein